MLDRKKEYKWTLKHRDVNGSNLLNPYKFVQGFYWFVDDEVNADTFAYSEKIRVNPNAVYQGNNGVDTNVFRYVDFYDFNKVYVSTLSGWRDNFTVPSGSYYVIVSIGSLESGTDPENVSLSLGLGSNYEPYFESREVYPIYKKLSRGYKLESGKQFYRDKLSGNLKLIREDFDYINALPFETEFKLEVEDLRGFQKNYRGLFYKTDCKWDEDDRKVELKMEPDDEYVDILAGLDNTYNLIDLAPELDEVEIRRRPLIQVYIPGDTVVTNILGGTYWEQEIQTDPIFDHNALVNDFYFANPKNVRIVPSAYASGLSIDITGEYDDNRESANGLYRIDTDTDTAFPGFTRERYRVVRISDGVTLYQTGYTDWRQTGINLLEFEGINGETGKFYFTEYRIYVRYYTDLLDVRGTSTYAVPDEDIVANNRNYRRVIGYNIDDFYVYDQTVGFPTKYGKLPNGTPDAGKYYKEFLVSVSTGLSNPIPVSASNWKAVSLWFFNTLNIRYTEFIDGQDFTLRDGFALSSVIDVLLREMGSSLRHKEDEAYSEFLYSNTNPLGGFTYLDFDGGTLSNSYSGNIRHFITPKSNIIAGEYDQPAQKAEASLTQMLNFLRDCYRVFWHVENGKLRLEHITWYQKGGTYGSPILGSDLTQIVQPKNGKTWDLYQSKYEYDKEQMPERFEFGWMDDVSPPFDGNAIEIVSNYVQRGRVEDLNVNGITSDIDFIMGNPQDISKSGFCVIATVEVNGVNKVPYIEKDIGYNQEVVLQNGFLSFSYLHPKFHIYDLPSDNVKINGDEVNLFQNNNRQKKQEVIFPAQQNINPYNLIRTNLGDGIVDELKIDFSSRIVKATIKHDTE